MEHTAAGYRSASTCATSHRDTRAARTPGSQPDCSEPRACVGEEHGHRPVVGAAASSRP
jgi:hypothetical protein